ncbi:hypothetical protein [Qipengyuania sp. DGS5-3]|uniref:hypothetical protein n=1 Tax=Qipengyuania sp. DGS5-3 TaxID=3349632 RepID=UPI0036D2F55B
MTEKNRIIARRWKTPFENSDPDKVHLLKVTYPSCPWVIYNKGPHYDFSEFTDESDTEILVFSEEDQTVYRVSADADTVRIHDERDLEQIDDWPDDVGKCSMRLVGSELQRSLSSFMNGEAPTYLLTTGNDCVEFICLNDPVIEAVGTVSDSRSSFH